MLGSYTLEQIDEVINVTMNQIKVAESLSLMCCGNDNLRKSHVMLTTLHKRSALRLLRENLEEVGMQSGRVNDPKL